MPSKKVFMLMLLAMLFAAPVSAADMLSSFLGTLQNIASAMSRPATADALVDSSQDRVIPLVAQSQADTVFLDWSNYWPEKQVTLNTYAIYRSVDQQHWTFIGSTRFSSFSDITPLAQEAFYRVEARYTDHTVASDPVSVLALHSASQAFYASVPVLQGAASMVPDKVLNVTYTFDRPQFTLRQDGYTDVTIAGLSALGAPGAPQLLYRSGYVLIPEGYRVASVEYVQSDQRTYRDLALSPAQPPVPLGYEAPSPVSANAALYASTVANPVLMPSPVQYLGGLTLLPLKLTPLQYTPARRDVVFSAGITVKVNLLRDNQLAKSVIRPSSVKQLNAAADLVQALVDNPQDLAAQVSLNKSSLKASALGSNYDMLIVAPAAFAVAYQPLIDFKNTLGIKTVLVSVEQIYATTSGRDNAEKIKNFIRSYYQTYGIQYVILGGDVEFVPTRKLLSYCPAYGGPDDGNMNTDVYFACLDDSWDPNNNGSYAEQGETYDRLAEVAIGRFPASNASEVTNIVNKVIAYQSLDPQNYFTKSVAIFGENLDSNTKGSYFTNYISPAVSAKFTPVVYADDVNYWSGTTLKSALSANTAQMIVHMGHSNHVYNAKIYNTEVSQITNTLPFVYITGGCFPNYFVYTDSISEAYLTGPKGAVAFVGNSHYGWYYPGSGSGPSARYANDTCTAITQRNLNALGKAVMNARERGLANWSYSDGFNCDRLLFLAINLLGDPSMPVVTDFAPKKGVTIKNTLLGWQKGVLNISVEGVGSALQSLSLYYRYGVTDSWKLLQTVNALTTTYTLDTRAYTDCATFQLKATAQYPDGPLDSPVSTFGIDNTPPLLSSTVQSKVYNTDVSINISASDAASGVNRIIYSVGDIVNQQYLSPPTLSQGGTYTLTYYALDQVGNISPVSSVNFSIDKSDREGFPLQLGGAIYGVPTYKDVDHDGALEIAVQSNDGKLYLLKSNGRFFTGWENGKTIGVKGASCPAIADVDRDGQDEIIAFGSFTGLNVFRLDGSLKWQALNSGLSNNSSPVIADINNDGTPEIIVAADGQLYALDGQTGRPLSGFPVSLAGGQSLDVFGTPAVADIDGDGFLEIALAFSDASQSYFKVYRSDGTLLWSKTISATWMTSSPVIGDLNNDGKVELVFAGGEQAKVYVYDPAGNLLPGFPYNAGSGHFAFSPALADLGGDGKLEIVIPLLNPGQNKLYAIRSDGTCLAGFPFNTGAQISSGPCIGDLSGDGQPDILIGGNNNQLHAYTLSGTEVAGFPKTLAGNIGLAPVLLDLDNDGKVDILTGDWSGRLSSWMTSGIYSADTVPWGTFAHDPYHTGFYQTIFLDEPATYKKVSGLVSLKVRTFANNAWISAVVYEYSLDSSNGRDGSWTPMVGLNSQVTQMQWDSRGLNVNQDVWVRVRCRTADGSYSGYAARKILLDNLAPSAVTNLKITDPLDNGEKLIISWDKSTSDGAGANDLVNYTLVWNDGSGDMAVVLPKGTTSYQLATDKRKAYTVMVKTFDGFNYGNSALVGPVTPNDEIAPDPIYNLTATDVAGDNGGSVQLAWTHSASFKASEQTVSYRIYRALSKTGNWVLLAANWRDNKYLDAAATCNVVFDYKVVVTDQTWDVVSGVVSGSSKDDLPPALPVSIGLYDVPGDNGSALIANWTRSPDDGAGADDLVKYVVYLNQTSIDMPSGSTSYVFTGLQKNTLYSLALETVDDAGNRARSAGMTAYPRDNMAPQVPSLSISDVPNDQGTALQLTFPKSSDDSTGANDVLSYIMSRRAPGESSAGVTVAVLSADGRSVYSLRDNVSDKMAYRLSVSDGDNLGMGDWVTGIPLDNLPPAAPAVWVATDNPADNGGKVWVSWSKSADDGSGANDVLAYGIWRKTAQTDWALVATLPAGQTSFLDNGLSNCQLYYYQLEVRDKANSTLVQQTAPAIPADNIPPQKISGFSVADNPGDDGGKTLLTWVPNVDDTIAYYVYRNNQLLVTLSAQVSSYNDLTPQDSVTYSYQINAFDGTHLTASDIRQAQSRDNHVNPAALSALEDVPWDNGGALRLAWTQSTPEPNLLRYQLFRNGTLLAVFDKTTTYWIDASATKNILFAYKIKSIDAFGNEAFSNELSGYSLDNIPPAGMTLTGRDRPSDNGDAVELSWQYGRYENDVIYQLLRNGVAIATLNAQSTTYTDTGLSASLTCNYLIKADDGNNQTYSNAVTLKPLDNLPPDFSGAPVVSDVPGDNGGALLIQWASSPAPDLKGYNLYRSRDGISYLLLAVTTSNRYVDTSVANNQDYYYQVGAFDGTYEVKGSVATGRALDNLPPELPTGLGLPGVVFADNLFSLVVSWNALRESGLRVSLYRNDLLITDNLKATFYNDSGLAKGVLYSYYLIVDDSTFRVKSAIVSAMGIDLQAVDHPSDNGTTIDLSWSFPKETDLSTVNIQRNGQWLSSSIQSGAAYADTTVQPGVTYNYAIMIQNGTRRIFSPLTIVGAVDNLPPDMTRTILATDRPSDNGGVIQVSWSASKATDIKYYHVWRSQDAQGYQLVATINGTLYNDNVNNNQLYYYKVSAADGTYEVYSDPASAKALDNLPPSSVTGLTVADTKGDQGNSLTLRYVLSNETGVIYRLYRDNILLQDNIVTHSFIDNGLVKGQTYRYYLLSDDGTYQVKSAQVSGVPLDDYVSLVSAARIDDVPADQGTALQLSWLAPADTDLSVINLYRNGLLIKTFDRSISSYTDNNLTPRVTYNYRIETRDLSGNINAVTLNGNPVDNIAPDSLMGLQVLDPVDNGGVLQVSWPRSSATDLQYYELYRTIAASNASPSWSRLAVILPAAPMNYMDIGLAPGVAYSYRVDCWDGTNRSQGDPSDPTIAHDEIPPVTPQLTVIDCPDDRGGQILLNWTSLTADAASYSVLRDGVLIAQVTGNTYLDAAAQGVYVIVAQDAAGNQSRSASSPLTRAYCNVPSLSVSDVAQDNGTQLKITWACEDPQLVPISLARRSETSTTFLTLKNLTTETAFVDTGLQKSSRYYYRLTYKNTTGIHTLDVGPSVPLDDITPAGVMDLSAQMLPNFAGKAVRISWSRPLDSRILGVTVYKSSGTAGMQKLITVNTLTTTFTDQDVQPYVTYNYRLDAYTDLAVTSGNIALIRTWDDTPPESPMVMDVPDDRGTQLQISWKIPSVDRLVKYFNGLKEIIMIPQNATNSIVTLLSPGSSYQFSYLLKRDGHDVESNLSLPATPRIDTYRSAPPTGVKAQDVYQDNGDSLLLSWSKSVDDRGGLNDVTGYNVYQGDTLIAQPLRNQFMIKLTGLAPDWQNPAGYSFKVSAMNAYGVESFSDVATGAPHDELPPSIPLGFAILTSNVTNEIRLAWLLNTDDTYYFQLYRNGVKWAQIPVTQNLFTDSSLTYGVQYSYQVSAVDYAGNESAKSSILTKTPVLTVVLNPGINLVSVPYLVSEAHLSDMVKDPSVLGYTWIGTAYNSSNMPFIPGRACFVKVSRSTTIEMNTPAKIVQDLTVSLSKGWNLIADPFMSPISLSALKIKDGSTIYTMAQAVAAGLITPKAYTIDPAGTSYLETSTLVPFSGAWVRVFKNIELVYPYASIGALTLKSGAPSGSPAWTLKVKANGKSVLLGQDTAASDGYDASDAFVPPLIINQLPNQELYIDHANWGQYSGAFMADMRQSDSVWTLVADNPYGSVEVVLDGLDTLPADKTVLVTDQEGNPLLVQNNRLVLHASAIKVAFNIQVMSNAVAFGLGLPLLYPNPCNINQTPVKIKVNSNKAASGQLKIFSLNGRQIHSQAVTLLVGDNVITWDGVTDAGIKPGSGLYFYILDITSVDGSTLKKKDKFVIWN